jgi:tetratricopeptide (TPR) repeat protein
MLRFATVVVLASEFLSLHTRCVAQIEEVPHSDGAPGQNQVPPRYDRDKEAEESSSRDTKIDLSPPKSDAKDHPFSDASGTDNETDTLENTQELHPWDPHKAAKDIEVGDFYFKRKNYRAALARYQDALLWKDNDAEANFRLGQCFEKVDNPTEAAAHYETYLKILPHGPYASLAQKALERLKQKISADAGGAKEQSANSVGDSQR